MRSVILLKVNPGKWSLQKGLSYVFQAIINIPVQRRTRLSDFTFTFHFHALEKEMATHSEFLPGESQGQRSLVSCHLWGLTESDTTGVS